MLPTQAVAPPARNRPLAHFRNEAGAFDLPSILTGVVVVGILTAGVLAAIFGVIPFAQDKGAQQDLDATRTAEGVAKARDGQYISSDGLRNANLLNGPGSSAADTDTSGSCYVGISKSGSGKLFYSSNAASASQELTSATNTGCITSSQRDAMIEAVGGAPGSGSAPEDGVTFTPIAERTGVNSTVTAYMNAELRGYYGSPLLLAAMKIDAAGGDSDEAWVVWENSPEAAAMDAAYPVMANNPETYYQYKNLTESSAVAGLAAAAKAADDEFWSNPTKETQQAMVDTRVALYNSGMTVPDARLVASTSFPDAFSDITFRASGENHMIYLKAALPAGVDTTNAASFTSFAYARPTSLPAYSFVDYVNGVPYWTLAVDAGVGQTWTAGAYSMSLRVTDPTTNIVYYKDFTVTVTP